MNSAEENALLTNTDPENPGGDLLRRYWQPVALSRELLPDTPLPVRLLGEDLVLFRSDQGKLGLLGLHCPHRRADLSYGRLENGGLRCLYHGWLFNTLGRCLEQPAEPADSRMKDNIRHTAYPCHEAAGAIFAYLGPGEPPDFPNFHFIGAPPVQVYQNKVLQRCNYLQANEGNIDPAHLSFLHWFAQPLADRQGDYRASQEALIADNRPKIEIERTRFGVRLFTCRNAGDGKSYLRVTNFVLPNLSFFAGSDQRYGEGGYSVHWHVPIDNERHWRYEFYYHPRKKLDKELIAGRMANDVGDDFVPVRGAHNRYLQDREQMKGESFSGMGQLFLNHDTFAVESPGLVHDRSREHLSTTDIAIVAARRMMLDAMKEISDGNTSPLDLRAQEGSSFNDLVVLSRMLQGDEDPRAHCKAVIESSDFHAYAGDPPAE